MASSESSLEIMITGTSSMVWLVFMVRSTSKPSMTGMLISSSTSEICPAFARSSSRHCLPFSASRMR